MAGQIALKAMYARYKIRGTVSTETLLKNATEACIIGQCVPGTASPSTTISTSFTTSIKPVTSSTSKSTTTSPNSTPSSTNVQYLISLCVSCNSPMCVPDADQDRASAATATPKRDLTPRSHWRQPRILSETQASRAGQRQEARTGLDITSLNSTVARYTRTTSHRVAPRLTQALSYPSLQLCFPS